MQPPDHDSVEPRSLSLQNHEIADAALVEPPAIVDHQHVAGSRPFERLQEDIDAADMSSRKRTPSQAAARDHGSYRRWRATHRDVSTNACIRQMGGGQCRKPPSKLLMIHAGLPYGQRPLATARRGVSFESDRTGENTSRTVAPSGPASPDPSSSSLTPRSSKALKRPES